MIDSQALGQSQWSNFPSLSVWKKSFIPGTVVQMETNHWRKLISWKPSRALILGWGVSPKPSKVRATPLILYFFVVKWDLISWNGEAGLAPPYHRDDERFVSCYEGEAIFSWWLSSIADQEKMTQSLSVERKLEKGDFWLSGRECTKYRLRYDIWVHIHGRDFLFENFRSGQNALYTIPCEGQVLKKRISWYKGLSLLWGPYFLEWYRV